MCKQTRPPTQVMLCGGLMHIVIKWLLRTMHHSPANKIQFDSRQVKPAVYVTYNGDFFDWPFIETRASKLGMDMHEEIGFRMDSKSNTCLSK